MMRLLPQPKPQSAEATIVTLCDRLTHSLLIEDRRAALLGLKGFSHEYRELVVSNGLKGILEALVTEKDDPDSRKACVETLLILFGGTPTRVRVVNKKYISLLRRPLGTSQDGDEVPADDISMWLADEVSHNKDVIETLLTLVDEGSDPFLVVYALQLISAVTANRPSEARTAILASPLGVATLVKTLDSPHDMVRNEGVLLLSSLASNHSDIQKMVAFGGAFERTFAIIKEEGGIIYGGAAVDDCLNFLWALLQYNVSNQKQFAEMGGLTSYVNLLEDISETDWSVGLNDQVVSNVVTTLQLGELFVVPGSDTTRHHQDFLARAGVLVAVLRIAFGPASPVAVRVAALGVAAALVAENHMRQSELLSLDVPYYDLTLARTVALEPELLPVSRALLGWALRLSSTHLFELRAAARLCLSAALHGNAPATTTFFADQITLYKESEELSGNLIAALADFSDANRLDPYRIWFAAAIVTSAFEDPESDSREQLNKVVIGDESTDMEAHSLVQAVAGQLQTALSLGADKVAILAYLQLLTVWIHDDVAAAAEFTAETSVVQALISYVSAAGTVPDHHPLVESIVAVLLGTSYLFCPSDAPFPRAKLHALLVVTPGRDQYTLQLRRLRQNPEFRDFDADDIFEAPKRAANGAPRELLLASFVSIVKAHMSRITYALDLNPEIEPSSKVSLDMFDELTTDLKEKAMALEVAHGDIDSLKEELRVTVEARDAALVKAEHATTASTEASTNLESLKSEFDTLQNDKDTITKELETATANLASTSSKAETLGKEKDKLTEEVSQLTQAKDKSEAELAKFARELYQTQRAQAQTEKDLAAAEKKAGDSEKALAVATKKVADLEKKLNEMIKRSADLESSIKTETHKAATAQKELDGLKSKHQELTTKLNGESTKLSEATAKISELESSATSQEQHVRLITKELEIAKSKLKASEARSAQLTLELATHKSDAERSSGAETELTRQKNEATKRAEEAEAELLRVKSELEKQAEATLSKHKSELEESAKKAADKQSELEERAKQAEAKQSELEERAKQAEMALSTHQSEAGEKGQEAKKFQATISELQAELQAQKDLVAKAQQSKPVQPDAKLVEELQSKQADLDELVILLDDLSEQKSAYKQRLKTLGEEVSDSEPESDEEDNDDEATEKDGDETKENGTAGPEKTNGTTETVSEPVSEPASEKEKEPEPVSEPVPEPVSEPASEKEKEPEPESKDESDQTKPESEEPETTPETVTAPSAKKNKKKKKGKK